MNNNVIDNFFNKSKTRPRTKKSKKELDREWLAETKKEIDRKSRWRDKNE